MPPADPQGLEDLLQQAPAESPLDLALAGARLRQALFDLDPDPVTLGRFQVLERIGAGGMGTVYSALDPTLERKLAIKVLGRRAGVDGDERVRELVLREARAAARLSHPNVVTVFEAGADGDQVYLAMELVEGETLRSWQRAGERSPEEVVGVYLQAGLGIAAAHAEGLVHGDFKPDNALMGLDGRVRVADFGLARPGEWDPGVAALAGSSDAPAAEVSGAGAIGESGRGMPLTAATTVAAGGAGGTPDYMAPELRDGAAASEASDQYAFCVSLFEAVHGRLPPAGGVGEEPVPDWLDQVLRRGLDPSPIQRFASMQELLEDLERGTGAGARPEVAEVPRRGRRWVVAAGVAVVLLIGAVLAVRFLAPPWWFAPPPRPTEIVPAGFNGTAVRSFGLSSDGSWLVHSDGTDLYRSKLDKPGEDLLTGAFEPRAIQPDISPDGRQVAFSADGALFVMPVEGDEPPRRVAGGGYDPQWSPDGRALAYTTEYYPEIKSRLSMDGDLRIVDVESGAVIAPLNTGDVDEVVHLDWSPDGKWLVVTGYAGLIAVRADGSMVRPVTRMGWSPRWVEGGHALLFMWMYGRDPAIFRVGFDPETGESDLAPVMVVQLSQGDGFPAWMELIDGGERLVLQRKRWPATMLRVPLDPATGEAGEPVPIFAQPNTYTTPAVSPDGEWLAFASYDIGADLFVSRLDGSELRALSQGENHTRNPTWTPDGARVLFEGTRYNHWNSVWAISPDGGDAENLSGYSSMPLMIPRYAPDGKRLAVSGINLWPSVVDPTLPWMQQLMGQEIDENADWLTTDWSPDGQWIAAARPSEGISRLRSDNLQRELLLDHGDFAVWLPDSRHLLVDDGSAVLRLDSETGETTEILDVAPLELAVGASLALTPDANTLIVAAQQPGGSLEIVEFLDGD